MMTTSDPGAPCTVIRAGVCIELNWLGIANPPEFGAAAAMYCAR
jgi:hypothetical protein